MLLKPSSTGLFLATGADDFTWPLDTKFFSATLREALEPEALAAAVSPAEAFPPAEPWRAGA